MKIQINTKDVRLTRAIREHVELRLGFAFNRFEKKINSITVWLEKSDDHPSRIQGCCRIEVSLRRRVRVKVTDAKIKTAINRACVRAAGAVGRILERDDELIKQSKTVPSPRKSKGK